MQMLFVLARFILGWMYTLVMSATTCAIALAGFRRAAWLLCCKPWARIALKIIQVHINIVGRQNLTGPALFVSNHQSMIDVVFLPSVLPRRLKWIAKRELRNVPIWGWAFSTGALFIDRTDPKSAVAKIRNGIDGLPPDWSICIFPEGTRSADGALGSFKKGVVRIALQTRLPIVPMGFCGSHDILPTKAVIVHPGHVELTVGERIDTDHWNLEDLQVHLAEVRAAVQVCVDESRRRHTAHRAEQAAAVGLQTSHAGSA